MNFNNIGYFQLDNLLQSRIPMVLVLLDEVPLKSWYNSLVGMHLDNITIRGSAAETLAAIKNKNIPPHFAVVVLDLKAEQSPSLVEELETLGYINAYYVRGGWEALVVERQNPDQ